MFPNFYALSLIKTPKASRSIASLVTSPVKGVSPATDAALRAALDNRPVSVIKSVTRDPDIKVTSAKLLEKLKQSEPPALAKSVPEAATYEPISPASPEKPDKVSAKVAPVPFGNISSLSQSSSVAAPKSKPFSAPPPAFGSGPAPAACPGTL